MKALYCCLIGLFLFVSSGNNKLEAEKFYSNSGYSFFGAKSRIAEKYKCLLSSSKSYSSSNSKKTPQKTKKRNRKGVKPLFFCIVNGSSHQMGFASFEDIVFKQISYCFYTFSGNGKRGPPIFQA